MNTVGQRTQQLISHLGLTKNGFAQKIGVSSTVINGIVKDSHKPGSKVLDAIKREYPDVSTDWLLTGDGNMIGTTKKSNDFGYAVIERLELELSELRQVFSQQLTNKDQQIAAQFTQIASLTRMLESAMGKHEDTPNQGRVVPMWSKTKKAAV